jgi:hypothetical protein
MMSSRRTFLCEQCGERETSGILKTRVGLYHIEAYMCSTCFQAWTSGGDDDIGYHHYIEEPDYDEKPRSYKITPDGRIQDYI